MLQEIHISITEIQEYFKLVLVSLVPWNFRPSPLWYVKDA